LTAEGLRKFGLTVFRRPVANDSVARHRREHRQLRASSPGAKPASRVLESNAAPDVDRASHTFLGHLNGGAVVSDRHFVVWDASNQQDGRSPQGHRRNPATRIATGCPTAKRQQP
jgi:hypothetical protein